MIFLRTFHKTLQSFLFLNSIFAAIVIFFKLKVLENLETFVSKFVIISQNPLQAAPHERNQ